MAEPPKNLPTIEMEVAQLESELNAALAMGGDAATRQAINDLRMRLASAKRRAGVRES